MTHPMLADWDGPFGLPDFTAMTAKGFPAAFDAAMAAHLAEVEAIAADPAPPDFANTLAALERSGQALDRICAVFFTLASSSSTLAIQEVERLIAPKLSSHGSTILTNPALWSRVRAVAAAEGLAPEEARVADLTRRRFVRAGADLDPDARERMRAIRGRLAELGTGFSQAVLADEQGWTLPLDPAACDGLPDALVASATADGAARGLEGPAITLSRSSVVPFLTHARRRDLREAAWRAWTARGEGTTWPMIAETLALRAEQARLLGHESYAAWKLEDQMARTPAAVRDLLVGVWEPAKARAAQEAADLAALAAEAGINGPIEPWDWRYLSEKQRLRKHDVDAAAVESYLSLDNIIDAAFGVAGRLFDLEFREVTAELAPAHLPHPQARAWEVMRKGSHLGLFVGDYFARPGKRSGAWASALRRQQKLRPPERPVILNTLNLVPGEPTLLSLDDARTLFHEFGHALHGLLSDVTYPSISGTAVVRDFVELPSQLFEHWLGLADVLRRHARHVRTGEPIPQELIDRLKAAETFNQGFETVEYLGSALVDLEMHEAGETAAADPAAFEAAVLARIGMPREIGMRHRSPHFLHVFAGDGYASGYYSYLWSEVMDADAFRAFEETGDPFDKATAQRLEMHILAAGGRQDPAEAWRAFRGAMPGIGPLLQGRGLAPAPR